MDSNYHKRYPEKRADGSSMTIVLHSGGRSGSWSPPGKQKATSPRFVPLTAEVCGSELPGYQGRKGNETEANSHELRTVLSPGRSVA